ncbi:MAG TPA: LptA/OstA family protein [Terriglobales bacterium]|nr:LptA/OstA family protein [Terriglobales bacterium]
MALPVTRLRRWFAAAAILMIAIVAGMYLYARWRVGQAVHQVPAKLGLDIQQTAEGFSISKSEQGRTQFTVSASKAVQFKQGGRAALHNVKIVIYGKDSSRFDRIAGDDFEYDPATGNVTAKGRVLIDLEANPEGLKNSDQTPPPETNKPIHLETEGLVFNKDSGDGSVSGRVVFQTPDAMGSAVGAQYFSKTGVLTLRSQVEVKVNQPGQYRLTANHGVIQKAPRTVVLNRVHLVRSEQELQSDEATFYLRDDNTVERILANGDVEGVFRGTSTAHSKSDHAEMSLTGNRNQLTQAVLTGNVQLTTEGAEPAQAYAGRATLHFGAGQLLETVHAEDGVRLEQRKLGASSSPTPSGSASAANQQTVEMTAPAMDFLVKDGKIMQSATTSGPPQITISQSGNNQKTVVTADQFTARFAENNRLSLLHGEPNSRIVSSQPGQPDRVSTSPALDVVFQPQGGVSTITQSRGLTYVSGTQKALAERGTYTEADQTLVLTGSPRVIDGGMTTTAETVRFNRVTGDAVADLNVKSTYSDLKPQPDGALLATSDPIHVVGHTMTAHRSSAVAIYSGNARLWQNSNVVEAPNIEFDRDHRSMVAKGSPTQPVKTVLVQVDSKGKATPVTVTSELLTYLDADRKIFLTGGVTAKGADATMTSRRMTVFLAQRSPCKDDTCPATSGATQVDKIVAENDVVIVEPTRRAIGQRLVYTAADDKYILSGGPPSIFDAEHGKITGDSLTFYRHDDRVLVEGKSTAPAVTRTQVAR